MDVSTINLRVLKACLAFAAKDEERYLNGVLLELDERGATYVANDGVRLIAYRDELTPNIERPDAAKEGNRFVGRFIIPPPQCRAFKLSKDDDGYAKIFGGSRLTIAFGLTDITFAPIDGVYPNWRRAVPAGQASGKLAQYNLKQLADFRKFAESLGLSDPFIAHNGEGPAMVWYPGQDHCFGIVMPIKLTDEAGRVSPEWARGDGGYEQGDLEDPNVIHMTRQ